MSISHFDYRLYIRKLTRAEKHFLQTENRHYRQFKYIVIRDIYYTLNDIWQVIVPRGFLSDGCSGPGRDKWSPRDWIVHDWLYYTGGYCTLNKYDWQFEGSNLCRRTADSVFKGKYFYRRLAVRLFARKYFNGMSKENRPRQIREDLLQPAPRRRVRT
jgi:hypothetical protein